MKRTYLPNQRGTASTIARLMQLGDLGLAATPGGDRPVLELTTLNVFGGQ